MHKLGERKTSLLSRSRLHNAQLLTTLSTSASLTLTHSSLSNVPTIYLTDGRDRSIYKTTMEPSRLLLPSFQWLRQQSIAFHACPFFHACFLFFYAENNHANKGKNKISQRKLFKLSSLLASDFSFTDPKRISGGLSIKNSIGCTYAQYAK